MKLLLYTLITIQLFSQLANADTLNEQAKKLAQIPHPKVFRSVLNERPRMLTILLDDKHAIAYDTWHGLLGLGWQVTNGPLVNFTGPVYDGAHGKQPLTLGDILFENKEAEFTSSLGTTHFLGYSTRDDKVILKYGIKNSRHQVIAVIEELPQFRRGVLKRSFRVSPSSAGQNIRFTPVPSVKWKQKNSSFKGSTLSQPLSISTTL